MEEQPPKIMKYVREEYLNPKELEDYNYVFTNELKSLDEFIALLKSKFDFSKPEYKHTIGVEISDNTYEKEIDYFYCSTSRLETDEEYDTRLIRIQEQKERELKEVEEKRIKDEEDKIKREESDKYYVKNSIESNFYKILDDLHNNFTKEEFKEIVKKIPYKTK
jgi:hypothetical protein